MCVCVLYAIPASFVCLCVCSCPVRSFVAGAINSPQSSAPGVHSFADILCSVISLYAYSACCREILTLSKSPPRSLPLNISRAFTYQVSNAKGKFINVFTPRWCGNCAPLGHRLREEALKRGENRGSSVVLELTQPFWCICCTEILTSSLVWLPQDWVIVCLCFYCLN